MFREKKPILPYPQFGWFPPLVMIFFSLVFLGEGLPGWILSEQLEQSGAITVGTIVGFRDESRDFAVKYRFDAVTSDGEIQSIEQIERTNALLNQALHNNLSIRVMYDPNDPSRSRIIGNNTAIFQSLVGLAGFVGTIIYILRYIQDVRKFIREGKLNDNSES